MQGATASNESNQDHIRELDFVLMTMQGIMKVEELPKVENVKEWLRRRGQDQAASMLSKLSVARNLQAHSAALRIVAAASAVSGQKSGDDGGDAGGKKKSLQRHPSEPEKEPMRDPHREGRWTADGRMEALDRGAEQLKDMLKAQSKQLEELRDGIKLVGEQVGDVRVGHGKHERLLGEVDEALKKHVVPQDCNNVPGQIAGLEAEVQSISQEISGVCLHVKKVQDELLREAESRSASEAAFQEKLTSDLEELQTTTTKKAVSEAMASVAAAAVNAAVTAAAAVAQRVVDESDAAKMPRRELPSSIAVPAPEAAGAEGRGCGTRSSTLGLVNTPIQHAEDAASFVAGGRQNRAGAEAPDTGDCKMCQLDCRQRDALAGDIVARPAVHATWSQGLCEACLVDMADRYATRLEEEA